MQNESINKLKTIQDNINNLNYEGPKANIICVSKTFTGRIDAANRLWSPSFW